MYLPDGISPRYVLPVLPKQAMYPIHQTYNKRASSEFLNKIILN
jgi:hypothetical protein